MKKTLSVFLFLTSLLLLSCSIFSVNLQTIRGSGVVVSETRPASGFSGVELQGSADVTISLGETESVLVEAEDNILPLIETNVRNGKLIIGNRLNTSYAATKPVRVTVTMKSLDTASLPGSGNITISGLNGGKLDFSLSGSGNITARGTVDSVSASLSGSGNILCQDLQAKAAQVKLYGSGNVSVFASESLNATISGSGNVTYYGSPAQVNKSVTGSGSIEGK